MHRFAISLIGAAASAAIVAAQPAPPASPQWITTATQVRFAATRARAAFVVETSAQRDATDGWLLVVRDDGHPAKEVSRLPFVTSGGQFRLALVDVSGDGREEFFLVTAAGGDATARNETLRAFQLQGARFTQVLGVPISGVAGTAAWRYDCTFVDTTGDGVADVSLVRHSGESAAPGRAIPTIGRLIYVWSTERHELTLRSGGGL